MRVRLNKNLCKISESICNQIILINPADCTGREEEIDTKNDVFLVVVLDIQK